MEKLSILLLALLFVSASCSVDGTWQRTGYHFQPVKNWMNDPNGPLFYRGLYHLFYQYNPDGPTWGNITWGHAVSRDLINWRYLELALVPDQWYDINGVWSGSATMVDGKPVLVYTGASNTSVQQQCKAYPADPADLLLKKWIKASDNPILVPPAKVNVSDFRDPVTAWKGQDRLWRIGVGSQTNGTGRMLQFKSKDFSSWELLREPLHFSNGTGMWECPDFYPVWLDGKLGSSNLNPASSLLKYVVKASTQGNDVYVVGEYDRQAEKFFPDIEEFDIGTPEAKFYDRGIYYASKTFFDPKTERRILWGWIPETDAPQDDVAKGWASVQSIPRQVWLDETNHALNIYPVEEVKSLRRNSTTLENFSIQNNSTVVVNVGKGSQLDIEAAFDVSGLHFSPSYMKSQDAIDFCSGVVPSHGVEILGPFGIKVLVSEDMQEETSIFFKLFRYSDGWKTVVCKDLTRSSTSSEVGHKIYGSYVQVHSSEKEVKLRVLVDHSIVETFAQDGKSAVTARVYPRLLDTDMNGHLIIFNHGSKPVQLNRLSAWEMQTLHFKQ